MECIVRVNIVFWPAITRLGLAPPFPNLGKAPIWGWATQFGTRISSRLVS
jgi:hypothetical protein